MSKMMYIYYATWHCQQVHTLSFAKIKSSSIASLLSSLLVALFAKMSNHAFGWREGSREWISPAWVIRPSSQIVQECLNEIRDWHLVRIVIVKYNIYTHLFCQQSKVTHSPFRRQATFLLILLPSFPSSS